MPEIAPKSRHFSSVNALYLSAALALSPIAKGQAEMSDIDLFSTYYSGEESALDVPLGKISRDEELLFAEMPNFIGTLTEASSRVVPATITAIDKKMIWDSAARSLNELLDIHVPNLMSVRHDFELPHHLGVRGNISDRDEKYLMLVNGRVMNEQTHFGALAERDLVLLQDIRRVDVVRGSGSAIYGPGAIAMVINVETENALTFEGTELITRGGAIEEFYSIEAKHAQKFSDTSGIYLYGGIAQYTGASPDDAPAIAGTNYRIFGDPNNLQLAGNEITTNQSRFREGYRNKIQQKYHAQLTLDNIELWARYSRGGESLAPVWFAQSRAPADNQAGYQQFTISLEHNWTITDSFSVQTQIGYDFTDYERILSFDTFSHREDQYSIRSIANWDIARDHQLAFGGEFSYDQFGIRSPGFPNEAPNNSQLGNNFSPWSTQNVGLVAEHQWNINSQWSTFTGLRTDKNTYTDWLFSPRLALIYTPTVDDTLKLILSRSVRQNFAEENRDQFLTNGENSDSEVSQTLEIRYDRTLSEHWTLGMGAYFHDLERIGVSSQNATPDVPVVGVIADEVTWGLELELTYQSESTRIHFSHGFTQLYDFDLNDINIDQFVTSEAYGFGRNLANWSNHISKMTIHHEIDQNWSFDGSLRLHWGYAGHEDLYNYNRENPRFPLSLGTSYPDDFSEGFDISAFLNLGLQYKPNKRTTLRIDGYNLLGVFDNSLNKNLTYGAPELFTSAAPAVAISFKYKL